MADVLYPRTVAGRLTATQYKAFLALKKTYPSKFPNNSKLLREAFSLLIAQYPEVVNNGD